MHLTPIPCTDAEATALMQLCRKNYSTDCAPFYMSQLTFYDLQTPSPISKQTIDNALDLFIENLPEGDFKLFLDQRLFENDVLKYKNDWYKPSKADFEKRFYGWMTSYSEQVRSPLRKEEYPSFLERLYHYLGNPKFFAIRHNLFVTPNYFCDNINAFVITQNHGKFPTDKLAMFSFFCPD